MGSTVRSHCWGYSGKFDHKRSGKVAKFSTGAVLFRVTKVMAVEGSRCFERLARKLADEIRCRSM